jgi:hypothetical protein
MLRVVEKMKAIRVSLLKIPCSVSTVTFVILSDVSIPHGSPLSNDTGIDAAAADPATNPTKSTTSLQRMSAVYNGKFRPTAQAMCHLAYVGYVMFSACAAVPWIAKLIGAAGKNPPRRQQQAQSSAPSVKACWSCSAESKTAQLRWECRKCGAVNEEAKRRGGPRISRWWWTVANYAVPALVAVVIATVWLGGHIVLRDSFEARSH